MWLATVGFFVHASLVLAQSYSSCNPLTSGKSATAEVFAAIDDSTQVVVPQIQHWQELSTSTSLRERLTPFLALDHPHTDPTAPPSLLRGREILPRSVPDGT